MIADAAELLPDLDDPAFGWLFDRFADRRVVLLGEASHGTSEFYRARGEVTWGLSTPPRKTRGSGSAGSAALSAGEKVLHQRSDPENENDEDEE